MGGRWRKGRRRGRKSTLGLASSQQKLIIGPSGIGFFGSLFSKLHPSQCSGTVIKLIRSIWRRSKPWLLLNMGSFLSSLRLLERVSCLGEPSLWKQMSPSFVCKDQEDIVGQLQPRAPWTGSLMFCFAVLGMESKVL